jgi:rubrerythrin
MAYEIAKEESDWVYTKVIKTTNCTNKTVGHSFIPASEDEAIKIRKQTPKLKCYLWLCVYCGKVKESM